MSLQMQLQLAVGIPGILLSHPLGFCNSVVPSLSIYLSIYLYVCLYIHMMYTCSDYFGLQSTNGTSWWLLGAVGTGWAGLKSDFICTSMRFQGPWFHGAGKRNSRWPWHLHSQGNERVVSRVPFVAPDLPRCCFCVASAAAFKL